MDFLNKKKEKSISDLLTDDKIEFYKNINVKFM